MELSAIYFIILYDCPFELYYLYNGLKPQFIDLFLFKNMIKYSIMPLEIVLLYSVNIIAFVTFLLTVFIA